MNAPTVADVRHLDDQHRFELLVDGQICGATYRMKGSVMQVLHTGVPAALEGRGLAGVVVQAVLDHARMQGWRVEPVCSYVRAYMRRHPDNLDLLAS